MKLQFIRKYWGPWNWRKFAREERGEGKDLFKELSNLDRSILVAGCQRSGTSILTRALVQSPELSKFRTNDDNELDGAYILAGIGTVDESKRYCFQTTYLNESYVEYFRHKGEYQLVWLIRNPYSVIYSMLYNWLRYPLNELFQSCGIGSLTKLEKEKYLRYGLLKIPPIKRACYAYVGKINQLIEIRQALDDSQLAVVDYDDLVTNSQGILSALCDFLGLTYRFDYSNIMNLDSLRKAAMLTNTKRQIVQRICQSSYDDARLLLTIK